MIRNLAAAACLAGLLAGGLYLFTGCENSDSTEGAEFYIEPGNAVVTPDEPSVALTAVGGHEPYVWEVSDPSLGEVSGSGTDVTYTRSGGNGVNTVKVTDELGWTASASMSHQDAQTNAPFEDPSLDPSSATLSSDGDSITFQASGGEWPYSWSVGNDARGHIEPQGRDQAIYTRDASGNNTVVLQDSQDRVFIAQITQPATSTLDIDPHTASVSTNGGSVVFTASGGSGSYSWSRQSGPGSLSDSAGTSTVLNLSAGTAQTIVRLTDGITTVFATVDRN